VKTTIEKLLLERKGLSDRLRAIDTAVKALREVCPHPVWKESGHDSHYNYRTCTECGLEERI
jgi:ferredoxin-like protein FixX